MIRDRGVHYSKYTVGHIHVVGAGWSTFYKCEKLPRYVPIHLFAFSAFAQKQAIDCSKYLLEYWCVPPFCLHYRTTRTYAAQMVGYVRTSPPFSLHYRTHRLHADQICPNMGTSPNSGQCWPSIVRINCTFSEFPNEQSVWYNFQSGGFLFRTFSPRHVQAVYKMPNFDNTCAVFPFFRVCTQFYDKTDSLYFNLCQTNKNEHKTPTVCCTSSLRWSRIKATRIRHTLKKNKKTTERYITTTYANV